MFSRHDVLNRSFLWPRAITLSLAMVSAAALAQTTYGSLSGIVTDTTGAAVSGATVTLSNTGTGEKQTQETGGAGLYTFVNLQPGNYALRVAHDGFQKVNRENIEIQVQQAMRIDVPLPIGSAAQTVEVSSDEPMIQPESSSLGQVMEARGTSELPLNGRNVFSLVEIAPSVVMQGGAGTAPTGQNPFSWTNFQIGGGFANQNGQYLDGQPLNSGYVNLAVLIPTQDSIGEFKVQTHNLGPEWGKIAGGVLNLSTKSGNNQWHGEVYEYLRNRALNANNWFSNYNGLSKPSFTQNQFGGNLAGPILHDRTFFFFSYEGFRLRQGESFTDTVPTEDERNGDLAALALASIGGANPQIMDPCAGAATCTTATPVPFHGNIIPTGRINPTAAALLKLWPLPNRPGVINNYTVNTPTGGSQNQYVGRVDHNINEKQHMFVRFSWWNDLNLPVDPLGTGVCDSQCQETISSRDVALGYNYIFNANTIGNINASASRFLYNRTPKNAGYDLTTIGWPASFNAEVNPIFRTPPTPDVTGMAGDIMGTNGQGWIQDHNTIFTLSPSMTLIRGRHTIAIGGMFQGQLDNYGQTNGAGGQFFDTGAYTGLGFADFLLGWANNGSEAEIPALPAGKQNYAAAYFNDDFHATSKLTLNLGIRWDLQEPWTERFNRLSYWDSSAVNSLASAATGVNTLGAIELVNTSTHPSRHNMDPNYKAFAPRIGFGYSLDPKTAIRGGYGVFWIPIDSAYNITPQYDSVGFLPTQYTGNISAGAPSNTISTPWPAYLQPPGRSANYAADLEGNSLTAVMPNFKYGYMEQWNLDVQRQLWGGFMADVAYAASKGVALPPNQGGQESNQISDSYLAQAAGQAANGQTPTIATSVANPYASSSSPGSQLAQPTVLAGQLLRPFPQYGNLQLVGKTGFGSNYNALEATLQKRYPNGGTLMVAYTWSKLLSNTDTSTYWLESGGIGAVQDANDLHKEWSLSSQNVSQHLIVSYVLDLPIGRGQRWLGSYGQTTEKIISGWGADGITQFQAGFPVAVNAALNPYNSLFGAGLRPNVVPGCAKATSGTAQQRVLSGLKGGNGWIDSSCFTQPAPYTFGDEPRVDPSLRAAGIANWDFALFKNTTFGPDNKVSAQFRTEFYNLFNRTQFGNPGNYYNPTSTGFGWITSQANNPRLVQFAMKVMF